jgi:hypothetical protein
VSLPRLSAGSSDTYRDENQHFVLAIHISQNILLVSDLFANCIRKIHRQQNKHHILEKQGGRDNAPLLSFVILSSPGSLQSVLRGEGVWRYRNT